jgi:hypothetical protein
MNFSAEDFMSKWKMEINAENVVIPGMSQGLGLMKAVASTVVASLPENILKDRLFPSL